MRRKAEPERKAADLGGEKLHRRMEMDEHLQVDTAHCPMSDRGVLICAVFEHYIENEGKLNCSLHESFISLYLQLQNANLIYSGLVAYGGLDCRGMAKEMRFKAIFRVSFLTTIGTTIETVEYKVSITGEGEEESHRKKMRRKSRSERKRRRKSEVGKE